MKVLLLGAPGFMGPSVARFLSEAGHDVVTVSRTPHVWKDLKNVRHEVGNRTDPAGIAAIAKTHGAEAAIDMIGLTLSSTTPLVDALAGQVGRFVFISSCDVYQRYGALSRKETVADKTSPVSEDAPLRSKLYPYRTDPPRPDSDPMAWTNEYDKIPIEKDVLSRSDIAGTVLRLPMVYGPGDKQHRFSWMIPEMAKKAPVIEIDEGFANWRSCYSYVDDVGAAIALAATHPAAAGRIYNVGPQSFPTHAEWAKVFAGALGWNGEIRIVPKNPDDPAGKYGNLDFSVMLATDTGRIRKELGYVEPTPQDKALRGTIEWELGA